MLLPLIANMKGLAAKPFALADRAGDPDIGEKIHFQPVRAIALAGLAPASRDIEAEPARSVTARFRLGHPREEVANLVKQLDVGRRVGARSSTDRRLVDIDHLVEMLEALDPACAPGSVMAPFKSRASASRRMSPTSELLPEPDTPVTQMKSPNGKPRRSP